MKIQDERFEILKHRTAFLEKLLTKYIFQLVLLI